MTRENTSIARLKPTTDCQNVKQLSMIKNNIENDKPTPVLEQ
ncbi:hypothetical protein HDF26_003826 [Pedobacter cryoconitis]|nr:hypothetical protein [Pedobacter cryoconitis]